MKKVLVFRIGLLGDTIVSLPAFKAIRENFPGAEITLLYNLTSGAVNPLDLLAHTDFIDKSIPYVPGSGLSGFFRLWAKLRSGKYDVAITLPPSMRGRDYLFRDELFFRSAGIRKTIGFNWLHNAERASCTGVHETDRLLSLLSSEGLTVSGEIKLASMLKVGRGDGAICEELFRTELRNNIDGVPVAFSVGSNMPAKCWPLRSYSLLGEMLISRLGILPVIFGGPKEKQAGDALLKDWGGGINLAGRLSVIQSYYLLKKCRFYIGNDTGVMHLAALAGLKCLALFSARDVDGKWNPYGCGHVVIRKEVSCQGCMLAECLDKQNACLTAISPDQVFDSCSSLMIDASNSIDGN